MAELKKYTQEYKNETVTGIAKFFNFHSGLVNGNSELDENDYLEAEKTLYKWTAPDHELYVIFGDAAPVGFIHIGYRGDTVAWIEDVYVDENHRGMGIATEAIQIAEDMIKAKDNYTAVCLDVAPRNEAALRLYHKLGYDSLSLVTVRKEFHGNKRNKTERILGLDYKI